MKTKTEQKIDELKVVDPGLAGNTPVFMKNNLRPFVGPDQPFIQEFPEFR